MIPNVRRSAVLGLSLGGCTAACYYSLGVSPSVRFTRDRPGHAIIELRNVSLKQAYARKVEVIEDGETVHGGFRALFPVDTGQRFKLTHDRIKLYNDLTPGKMRYGHSLHLAELDIPKFDAETLHRIGALRDWSKVRVRVTYSLSRWPLLSRLTERTCDLDIEPGAEMSQTF